MNRHRDPFDRATILLTLLLLAGPAGADWPQWGGAGRDFAPEPGGEVQAWPDAGPGVLWQRDFEAGFATVIAANGRLFTMLRRGEQEVLVAISAKTGETLWEQANAAPVESDPSLDTSYGFGPNSTPLLAGRSVCSLGFTGIAQCLRAKDGKPVWRRDLAARGIRPPYFGHAASPIRYDNSMIVVAGGAHALDLRSGETLWSNKDFEATYASPILVERGVRRLLLVPAAGELVALNPQDGTLLWRHEHANQHRTILSSPVAGEDGWVFLSAYFLGSVGLELSADGGAVTERWENPRLQLSHSNAVRDGRWVYGSHNNILTAIDMRTGEIGWRHRGIRKANLLKVGKRFLLLGDLGRLVLASLSPDGITVHATSQILEGRAWTAPTLYKRALYVRTEETLIALDLSGRADGRAIASRSTGAAEVGLPDGFGKARRKLVVAALEQNTEALRAGRATFERWAEEDKAVPLARYYAGFAAAHEALAGGTDAVAHVDRAIEHTRAALAARKHFPDAHALLSGLYSMYYRLDRERAAVVGPMSEEHLELALLQQPDNPRAVMAHALDLLNSPPQYGGDRDAGLARVRDALALYEKPPTGNSGIEHRQGHAMAWDTYGQALLLETEPDRDAARAAFERALAIEPRFAGARRRLEALSEAR